jgi:hypothetical protein
MSAPLFSRRVIILFIAAMTTMFALSLIISANEESLRRGHSAGPGVYSTSAVGYAGFYNLLKALDMKTLAGERDPLSDAGLRGTLIVAEPAIQLIMSDESASSAKLTEARRLLLVLPKWNWSQDERKTEWVSEMTPAPQADAEFVLALAVFGSSVSRQAAPDTWKVNDIGYSPRIDGAAQLVHLTDGMRAVVGDGENALVAEIAEDDRTVWILSDPDVMSNHGIMKEDNGAFIVSLIEKLSSVGNGDYAGKPAIVFDETVHGYIARDNSILKMMLTLPFAIVTVLLTLSALMLVSAGLPRFGVPIAPAPVLDFGKEQLINNCARLLDYGGHHATVLDRYVRMTINSAARALHAPNGLSGGRLAEWADTIGRSRGVSESCAALLSELSDAFGVRRTDISRLMDIARRARKWKGEILNGPSVHSRHRKRDQA